MTGANQPGNEKAMGDVVRRRWWIVVLGTAVGIGAALIFTNVQSTTYDATATLLFRPLLLDVAVTGTTLEIPDSDPTREAATDVSLVSQENVMANAANQLGPPYNANTLPNSVSISSSGKADIVDVQASAGTAAEAARIANAVTHAYLIVAGQANVSEIDAAEGDVATQLSARRLSVAERTALRVDLTKLAVLAAIGPSDVRISQPAVPPIKPSSPKPTLDAVLGGVAGLVIGFALAFGTEQLDTRLRRPDEIERSTGLPLLGSIPRSRWLRASSRGTNALEFREGEPFRRLASKLRHLKDEGEIRSVLLTSAGPGSGKTTVALSLAVAAASGLDLDTLLVEADLRRPRFAQLLGLRPERGLSTALAGPASDADIQIVSLPQRAPAAARRARAGHGTARRAQPGSGPAAQAPAGEAAVRGATRSSLAIMPAGPEPANATSLFESAALRELIRSWEETYELTVVDGPPPLFVADAVPVAQIVDAVIIVARLGHDSAADITRLQSELQRLGIEPLGVVANCARPVKNPYAYR